MKYLSFTSLSPLYMSCATLVGISFNKYENIYIYLLYIAIRNTVLVCHVTMITVLIGAHLEWEERFFTLS